MSSNWCPQMKLPVNNTVARLKVSMHVHLAGMQVGHAFDDVVHERVSKHPVELNFIILENVLQRALWTVLGYKKGRVRRLEAGADESHDVIVLQILHLKNKC